ncbi:ATP-dependent RNA helicase-like protein DB10 [Bidens hawaiensis]|uniref:ATP-dependent RNA helicase-like protein DB10 n=1 Tax=Bidens hawaiensis TaxID=980011 RepID=UPI00404AD9A1
MATPSYAPEDPTLPKPWKGLVDGTTGTIYYWNPVNNVTQYDRPSGPAQPSTQKPNGYISYDDDKFGRSSNGGFGATSLSPDAYRRQHEITVSGDNVPPPFTSFEDTGFPSELLREVLAAGFTSPTPIQAQSWPVALQSRDIVAIAKTGSGKTLGYLVPGFIHLKRVNKNRQMGPTVLVLSPTRELATQIQAEAVKFGRSSKIQCTVCLYFFSLFNYNVTP